MSNLPMRETKYSMFNFCSVSVKRLQNFTVINKLILLVNKIVMKFISINLLG